MKISVNGEIVNLPDFLIIGTAKAGTTSLYYYLKNNPGIFFPVIKEPRYFSYGGAESREIIHPVNGMKIEGHVTSLDEYVSLFKNVPDGCLAGEASTQYLYDYENVYNNMLKFYGAETDKVKIIAILRNPVERAWSNYSMHRNSGLEPLGFMEAIQPQTIKARMKDDWPVGYDYLGFGDYCQQILFWKKHFKDIKIYLYEDLDDPEGVVNSLSAFLSVPAFLDMDLNKKFNVSGAPKNKFATVVSGFVFKKNPVKNILKHLLPARFRYKIRTTLGAHLLKKESMPEDARQFLVNYYRQDVSKLSELLGVSLEKWLR